MRRPKAGGLSLTILILAGAAVLITALSM